MYFISITDSHNYTHSIDNTIVEWDIAGIGSKGIEDITQEIQNLKKDGLEYYERLNLNPSRKYSFCVNFIHLDKGISCFIGKQVLLDKETHSIFILPIVRVKVNLNKYWDSPALKDLIQLLNSRSASKPILNKFDYAIDVPAPIESVCIFGSRKERGLYKGTLYYGQRGRDGFCKVYSKSAEQGLTEPLTRIEHTFSCVKHTKRYSFENIYIKTEKPLNGLKMTPTDKVIIDLVKLCQVNSLDFDSIIEKLDSRKKKDILEKLNMCGYAKVVFDKSILNKLLEKTMKFFDVQEQEPAEQTAENEWQNVIADIELPFEH